MTKLKATSKNFSYRIILASNEVHRYGQYGETYYTRRIRTPPILNQNPSPPTIYTEKEIDLTLRTGYQHVRDASKVVLISHAPPRGVRDRSFIGLRGGSFSVKEFLEERPVSLCLCGHIHEAAGIEHFQSTLVANSGSFKKGHYLCVEIGPELSATRGRVDY